MSEICLPLVVEIDYQKLEQLNEKFEESKKRLLDLAKLTKSGFAETCKRLSGVNEKIERMNGLLDDLKGRLSKNGAGANNFFESTEVSVIQLTASLVFLSEVIGKYANTASGALAILTAEAIGAGYLWRKVFKEWEEAHIQEQRLIVEGAKAQDRILDALKGAAKEGNIEAHKLLKSYSDYAKSIGDCDKALRDFLSGEGEHYDQIKKIVNAYYKEKDAAKEAADTQKYLSLLFGDLTNASDELNSKTGELSKTNADLYSVMDKYGVTSLTKLNDETKTLLSEYDLMQSHTTMNVALTEQFADAVAALIEKYRMLGKDAPAALDELYYKSTIHKQLLDNIPAGPDFSKTAGLMDQDIEYKLLANIPKPSFDYDLLPAPSEPSSKTDTAKGSGFFGGLWSSFKSGVDDLKKQFGFGEGKGLLGNLFGGKDTGGGLFGLLGSFGGPQEGILGTMQQFASMIPGIGGMISNIIGGIGTAFNALKSLFGGLTEEEKVAKDVTRDLGVSISEDLAKKIADTSKDVVDRFTAVTLHLGDIMRETDITAKNFDTFASRARDVFSLLETGMMNSAQATATLNDVFPQLAEEADKLGITFNKNMIDMIQLSRQFGLEVESIKQYVDEKLGIAVQGLTTATQNLGEIGQAEFDRLARAAAATILIASMIYVVKKKLVYRFRKGLLFNDRV